MAGVLGALHLVTAAAAEIDVSVRAFDPQPTYGPTFQDAAAERANLTDGKTVKPRIWTRQEAVGWVFGSPVTMTLEPDASKVGAAARLSLHVADAPVVRAPRRIDVYGERGGKRVHLSAWTNAVAPGEGAGGPLWVTTPAFEVAPRMLVVVHAGDRVLALDEIRLLGANGGHAAVASAAVADPVRDSGERHRRFVLERQAASEARLLDAAAGWPVAGLVDPFGPMRVTGAGDLADSFDAVGDGPTRWFGALLLNPTEHADAAVIEVPAPSRDLFAAFVASPVAAFPDTVAFDPLLPVDDWTVKLPPASLTRVLLRLDTATLGPGSHAFDVAVRRGGRLQTVTLKTAVRVPPAPSSPPRAVVWAYEVSKPIWKKPGPAFEDLVARGINVNVVHPGLLPGTPGKTWSNTDAARLRKRLNRYPKGTVHLLFLKWDGYLASHRPDVDAERWIRSFADWRERSERNGEWVAYIVDEPRGKRAAQLIEVARTFARVAPDVPLYANPLADITPDQLRQLEPMVTYWQPDYAALVRHEDFFSGLPREALWFYQNPRYGSKAETPAFYRRLGLIAAAHDLGGMGFWSYSDTEGSSAWDDFDGPRPDWAVVYEGDGTVVSSRRWEAFTVALGELPALAASLRACPSLAARARALGLDADEAVTAALRAQILERDCQQD